MPRKTREKSPTGVYHIVLRGNNKQTIFFDDDDKKVFLNRIKLAKQTTNFDIYSCCLMSNHVHILIKEFETPLCNIFRSILSSFVIWYNKKYQRIGNLFQDRFKSEPIKDDAHFLCAIRYIHKNPVKANMVATPEEYKWSSHLAYLNGKTSIINTQLALDILGGVQGYIDFMLANDDKREFIEAFCENVSDQDLINIIKDIMHTHEVTDLHSCTKETRNEIIRATKKKAPCTNTQLARITKIPESTVARINDK